MYFYLAMVGFEPTPTATAAPSNTETTVIPSRPYIYIRIVTTFNFFFEEYVLRRHLFLCLSKLYRVHVRKFSTTHQREKKTTCAPHIFRTIQIWLVPMLYVSVSI